MAGPRLNNEQIHAIEALVLRDPSVKKALRTLEHTSICDDKKYAQADKAAEAAIEAALHKVRIGKEKLTERQIDTISHGLLDSSTEGRGSVVCR